MANLSFRCPETDLVTVAQGTLLDQASKPDRYFSTMVLEISYCMGCGSNHIVTVEDTVTLDLTSAEIALVASRCTDGSTAVGAPLKSNRRRRVRKGGA